jgi:hypothetical protein
MKDKIEKYAKRYDISIERINVWSGSVWIYDKDKVNTDKFLNDLRNDVFVSSITQYFQQDRPKHIPNSVSITYQEL